MPKSTAIGVARAPAFPISNNRGLCSTLVVMYESFSSRVHTGERGGPANPPGYAGYRRRLSGKRIHAGLPFDAATCAAEMPSSASP